MNYTIIDETTNISDEYCRYIYVNNTSLSKPLCDEIIQKFEMDESKYEGITAKGINKNIKDTMDFVIPDETNWIKIKKAIHKELVQNLNNYIDKLNNSQICLDSQENSSIKFKYFDNFTELPRIQYYLVQRYKKNIGRYIYHNDALNDIENKRFRIITFLWYLNDVCEGGETVFDGKYAVKPTTGKLLLFPATWNYPHCGKVPISSDKYILTGWVYASG
uniref:Fe2OG dioxygenase domain-containing protein n=1 Tax=viral metagenome TaxID=1070528 RepID=A0A6C0LS60_9ZZZZ